MTTIHVPHSPLGSSINMTSEAFEAIRRASTGNFVETGKRRADGTWDVPLGNATVERVNSFRLAGESFSDCLVRVIALATSPAN